MFYTENDIVEFKNVRFNFIEVTEDNHLFTITLNRPQKRNAFTPVMVNEIAYALAYAQYQRNIWCVQINANGPAFCAGMDLTVFQNPDLDTPNNTLPNSQKAINLGDAFRLFTKPSVAKVEGPALAGAFLIICGCTFVAASDNASFGLPEVKRGIFPMQVIASLLRVTTPRQALQMCILAENYAAAKAKEFGLVSHLCTKDTIDETCATLIETILGNSPFAISKGIEAFSKIDDVPPTQQFTFMSQQLDKIRNSEDAVEGIKAFTERRQPEWKNS
ncbi:enoyl-CoA hydratase/isomerase family protein [Mucilaginibacter agri]|uniref:Enoyl-CoA hydratase n=1 Tax=Mucilaginibacter agri TaxID=2695265 RepID=A0A965ZLK7_9SPHI|nr:enoyl-CoA hydratase-related protein [Mucilaginibacter agri]NCD72297.1 enoyl-CoA hydratase [Mucilaginibacter agri]